MAGWLHEASHVNHHPSRARLGADSNHHPARLSFPWPLRVRAARPRPPGAGSRAARDTTRVRATDPIAAKPLARGARGGIIRRIPGIIPFHFHGDPTRPRSKHPAGCYSYILPRPTSPMLIFPSRSLPISDPHANHSGLSVPTCVVSTGK